MPYPVKALPPTTAKEKSACKIRGWHENLMEMKT